MLLYFHNIDVHFILIKLLTLILSICCLLFDCRLAYPKIKVWKYTYATLEHNSELDIITYQHPFDSICILTYIQQTETSIRLRYLPKEQIAKVEERIIS